MTVARLETHLNFADFSSDWDILLLMIPFLAVMALGMFGLDEKFATSSRHQSRTRRAFCGIDADGRFCLSDPDGKPCGRESSAVQVKATAARRIHPRPVRATLQRRGVQI
jgi:hypothetical protein